MTRRPKQLRQLEIEMDMELERQCRLIYASAAIALKRACHWEKQGILKLMDMTEEVWKECAGTNLRSMVQMLDEETGVEIQNGDGKSWRDLAFLNAQLHVGRMDTAKWMYMRIQQKKWIAPQVTACVLLALHRKCGFDADRIAEIYGRILKVEQENLFDEGLAMEQCRRETLVNIDDKVRSM